MNEQRQPQEVEEKLKVAPITAEYWLCRQENETKVDHTTMQIGQPLLYAWHIVCNLIVFVGIT